MVIIKIKMADIIVEYSKCSNILEQNIFTYLNCDLKTFVIPDQNSYINMIRIENIGLNVPEEAVWTFITSYKNYDALIKCIPILEFSQGLEHKCVQYFCDKLIENRLAMEMSNHLSGAVFTLNASDITRGGYIKFVCLSEYLHNIHKYKIGIRQCSIM
jgi:hypothetical protein